MIEAESGFSLTARLKSTKPDTTACVPFFQMERGERTRTRDQQQ